MILVTYSDQKTFLLTNEEFFKAKEEWKTSKSHWCKRLKADLTPFYRYAEVPEQEKSRKIYIEKSDGIERKLFKTGEKYYELLEGGDVMETELYGDEDNLVDQEDFFKIDAVNDKQLLIEKDVISQLLQ